MSKRDNSISSNKRARANHPDIITLTVVFKYTEKDDNGAVVKQYKEEILTLQIHKSRDVADVWERTAQWLSKEFKYSEEGGDTFKLMYMNQYVNRKASLREAEITTDAKIYVLLEDNDPILKANDSFKTDSEFANEESQLVSEKVKSTADVFVKTTVDENAQAPFDVVPKAPKSGYKVSPDMVALARMSLKELKEVENFKVENEHGSVEWTGKTDLTGVDLADTITIRPKEAEVYDDERHIHSKPAVGQKLNKTAIITLNNFKPKKSQTATHKEN